MVISIVGLGYVGLSLAVLFARKHDVIAIDIDTKKIDCLRAGISPLDDAGIKEYIENKGVKFMASSDLSLCKGSDFVVVSVPTNYDESMNSFDTSVVEKTIKSIIDIDNDACIVIKSTTPVGFTESLRQELKFGNIIFSPEFLRESKALYDNLHPSRIVVGHNDANSDAAHIFGETLKSVSEEKNVDVFYMNATEAESVKLFANTYLALRISYFNELDTFAESNGLDTRKILDGVCSDHRIGNQYNNPSFGYGGYCLPKDSKQLLSSYCEVPQNVISAIVESNLTRKKYVVGRIIDILNNQDVGKLSEKCVGVYRLTMKSHSDNFRSSSVVDVINELGKYGVDILIYEPLLNVTDFNGYEVVKNLEEFKMRSSIILANRYNDCLEDAIDKVYTRDIFYRD